jgi:hypothetical protein
VSVVVVTYDCAEFIAPCLDSVVRTTRRHSVELVVADNASHDDSLAVAKRSHPEAVTIDMGANVGFARAVNAGVAASEGRLVLLLNPDTVVQPGALDLLAEMLDDHPGVGVVAPKLLNSDGSDQGTARSFPTPAAALLGRRSPLTKLFPRNRWSRRYLAGRERHGDEPFAVDWVSGACLMARREDYLALGGLDEGFFMHFEDADFCHRMKATGRSVVCVPAAQVVHHEGGCRRGWPASQVGHFHYGAYRYWTKHHAPQAWNPLRLLAGAALGLRACLVIVGNQRHRLGARRVHDQHTDAPPVSPPPSTDPVVIDLTARGTVAVRPRASGQPVVAAGAAARASEE